MQDCFFAQSRSFGAAVSDETFLPQTRSAVFLSMWTGDTVCQCTGVINSVCTWTCLSGALEQRGYPSTNAVIHVFRGLFKSCIPHFPGEYKPPNTGTWEPRSLLVFNPTFPETHKNTCWKFWNRTPNCHIWHGHSGCNKPWLEPKCRLGGQRDVLSVNKLFHLAW